MADGKKLEIVYLRDGLKMEIEKAGFGAPIVKGDLVYIQYDTFLGDGTPKEKAKEIGFVVGQNWAIEALDKCILKLMVGAVVRIDAAPQFAYGITGMKPYYGRNEYITYHVTVQHHIPSFDPKLANMPFSSRFLIADYMRERGNFHFLRKQDQKAATAYNTAISYMDAKYKVKEEEKIIRKEFYIKVHTNLAATFLHMKQYEEACRCATVALKYDNTNTKALQRKATALKALGKEAESKLFLKLADFATENTKEKETAKKIKEAVVQTDTKDTSLFEKLPTWAKWTAGVATMAGVGILAYRWFQK